MYRYVDNCYDIRSFMTSQTTRNVLKFKNINFAVENKFGQ
jgi:hypothetical protein